MASAADDPPSDFVLTFDWTDAESITAAVIDAVAAATGDPPTSIEPLYTAVDPDALDGIFESRRMESAPIEPLVEFPYHGVSVQVSATGEGRVVPLP